MQVVLNISQTYCVGNQIARLNMRSVGKYFLNTYLWHYFREFTVIFQLYLTIEHVQIPPQKHFDKHNTDTVNI